LHHGPDDAQTTGFRREGVNLIGASSNIPKKAFNRIGTCRLTHNLARKGRYASKGENGEDMRQFSAKCSSGAY